MYDIKLRHKHCGWEICFFGLKVVNSINKPLKIYCYNSTIVIFSKNDKNGSCSKHIDIKYLVVKKHIKKHKVDIRHVGTELMIAYPMTKGLSAKQYKNHMARMRIVSSF